MPTGPVSGQLRDAHRGLFDMTPQAQAALMAAQRRVGDGTSAGRDLQALGGTFDPADYGCCTSTTPRRPKPPQLATGLSAHRESTEALVTENR